MSSLTVQIPDHLSAALATLDGSPEEIEGEVMFQALHDKLQQPH
jgi:hypothetical protein